MPSGSAAALIDRIFSAWCERHKLTPHQQRLVYAAVHGATTRREQAAALGWSERLVSFHAFNVRRKTGAATMRDVVIMVLREALEPLRAAPSGGPAR